MLITVGLVLSSVMCKDFLLVNKGQHDYLFAQEHNLENIAVIDDLYIYKTSSDNLLKFKYTLSKNFIIEEDQTISLNHQQPIIPQDPQNPYNYLTKQSDLILSKQQIPWHLARITNKSLPLTEHYPYNYTGSCHTNPDLQVDTYIVDTGIDVTHNQFSGRANWLANFADTVDTDCQNHGTHCAGIIGSRDYGVCKDTRLFAVKVLDCNGSGSLSNVMRGIEFVYNKHKENTLDLDQSKVVKSIISMSLGGGFSRTLNMVVEKCLEKDPNFYIVVAAGNENSDSCNVSPASAKNVITVMASDIDDNRARFSNWGKCSGIYAPGVDILSTVPDNKLARYSGTSMATPLVVGIINHYLHMYPYLDNNGIKAKLTKLSSKNVVIGSKKNTNNNLVYLHRKEK